MILVHVSLNTLVRHCDLWELSDLVTLRPLVAPSLHSGFWVTKSPWSWCLTIIAIYISVAMYVEQHVDIKLTLLMYSCHEIVSEYKAN